MSYIRGGSYYCNRCNSNIKVEHEEDLIFKLKGDDEHMCVNCYKRLNEEIKNSGKNVSLEYRIMAVPILMLYDAYLYDDFEEYAEDIFVW